MDAAGGALLPGLHDHHLHLNSLAAALNSLRCGPPDVNSAAELASVLTSCNTSTGAGWLRGIGYHPSIAGDIDRHWLDQLIPDRPVRIQHRGGRLWVLNSRALETLGLTSTSAKNAPPGLETSKGELTGRLFEADQWLRIQLNSQMPDLGQASLALARCGITGITDTTPHNGVQEWQHFQRAQSDGSLRQRVWMMGSHSLLECRETPALQRGEYKIHLLESELPDFDVLCQQIEHAHALARPVAVHCVTRTELVFTLAALERAGVLAGDRIEHASVTPPEQLERLSEMGLRVITQPNFIAERGDQYLADVAPDDQPWLYRCKSFVEQGVPLAGGSDAPFGNPDPWRLMRAAVMRTTRSGVTLEPGERISPEQALSLFLSPPASPGIRHRVLNIGSTADLCLLDIPWSQARETLCSTHVTHTWRDGELIYAAAGALVND